MALIKYVFEIKKPARIWTTATTLLHLQQRSTMTRYKSRAKVVDLLGRPLKATDLDLGRNIIPDFVFSLDTARGGSRSAPALVMSLVSTVDGLLVLKYKVIPLSLRGGKEGRLMMASSMPLDSLMFMIRPSVFPSDSSFSVFFSLRTLGCWFLMMVSICGCRSFREVPP